MVTSRTRSLPAENGWTGHQAPIAPTKTAKVWPTSLRTSVAWQTGGRLSRATFVPSAEVIDSPTGALASRRRAGVLTETLQRDRPHRRHPARSMGHAERVAAAAAARAIVAGQAFIRHRGPRCHRRLVPLPPAAGRCRA